MRVASDRINRVSTELIDCANKVAQVGGGDEETTRQQLEALQDTLENTELLRRDWASQVTLHRHNTHPHTVHTHSNTQAKLAILHHIIK